MILIFIVYACHFSIIAPCMFLHILYVDDTESKIIIGELPNYFGKISVIMTLGEGGLGP